MTERDQIIERVRDTLRAAPGRQPASHAAGRVLQAVWASPRPSWLRRAFDAWRTPALSGLAASAVAVAALAVGFVSRGAVPTTPEAAPLSALPAATGPATGPATAEYPMQLASFDAEAVLVPTQFVLEHATATTVSVVGDFNNWVPDALAMTKLPVGVWTTTVPLPPGRHVYAYVIDGTLFVADPRAPNAGDADYGREGSVVMVFAR